MRPVYLKFCGINSFSEPAEIDFTRLLEFGIFGVFGDTGAGKSTVLDCIGFALYGEIKRDHSLEDAINVRCDRASVAFEFEISYRGERRVFRAERGLRRKKNAPPVQTAQLFERKGETLAVLADGVRECNGMLKEIIGLEQKDFEKCIALPQGEFAQFVKSARADRVKLISRLFDLEAYGERLVKRANDSAKRAANDCAIAKTRLEPYEDATEEKVKQLAAELSALGAEREAREKAYREAAEAERSLSKRIETERERAKLRSELAVLEGEEAEIALLQGELSRIEKAQAALEAVQEGKLRERERKEAEEAFAQAEKSFARADETLRTLPEKKEEEDREIESLAGRRRAAEEAEGKRRRLFEVREQIESLFAKRRKEQREYVPFSYEAERAAIVKQQEALGEGGLPVLLGEKEKLFREEYGIFRGELEALTGKYPAIGEDTAPLIEKYAALAAGERMDGEELSRLCREREEALNKLNEELLSLERRKAESDARTSRIVQYSAEAERLREEELRLAAELEGIPSLKEAEDALSKKRGEIRAREEARRSAEEAKRKAEVSRAAAAERAAGARKSFEEAKARYLAALEAGGFADVAEARALAGKYGDPKEEKARADRHVSRLMAVRERLKQLPAEDPSVTEDALLLAKERLAAAEAERLNASNAYVLKEAEKANAERALAEREKYKKEYDALYEVSQTAERLKKLLEGNRFMEFVAEEFLQSISASASERLLSLTGGRYFLRYDGGFVVGDNFDGGGTRAVATLSGGETFLVSLSLALSLSAEICFKSLRPIEFFFLDEGFGTLDGRLADTVMDSLEKLKGEHFSIGIISHIEELKHRIDRKLTVIKATERRGSQIISD